jgi:hypothetical protein
LGLNSGPLTFKAGVLPLDPLPQPQEDLEFKASFSYIARLSQKKRKKKKKRETKRTIIPYPGKSIPRSLTK